MPKTINNNKLRSFFIFLSRCIMLIVCIAISGCALSKRGVNDNIYTSNQSPSVHIAVDSSFSYTRGNDGEWQHQFEDNDNRRVVLIHHILHDPNENIIDYFENPENWIYLSNSNIVDIERFTMKAHGEKWYVQDFVNHDFTMSCFMSRKLSAFTSIHDLFYVMYMWQIPPYNCKDYKTSSPLNNDQKQFVEDFRAQFAKDINISRYRDK